MTATIVTIVKNIGKYTLYNFHDFAYKIESFFKLLQDRALRAFLYDIEIYLSSPGHKL